MNIFSTLATRRMSALVDWPERFPPALAEIVRTIAFTSSGWCLLAAIVMMAAAGMAPARSEASTTRTG